MVDVNKEKVRGHWTKAGLAAFNQALDFVGGGMVVREVRTDLPVVKTEVKEEKAGSSK